MRLDTLYEGRINLAAIKCSKCREIAKQMMEPTTILNGEITNIPMDSYPSPTDIIARLKQEHPNHIGRGPQTGKISSVQF